MKWSPAQERAITSQGSNLVVSAGAGSGKTAVLVERILNLLATDPDLHIHQILVMTFTEAAAGEMRQRIVSGLERAVKDYEAAGKIHEARRFRGEMELLWQAQISTIHSFCLELIRQNFLALGIHPDFRLLDENERRVSTLGLAEQVLEEALTAASGNEVRRMMRALRLADAQNLIRVIIRLYDLARSQVDPKDWVEQLANAYPTTPVPLDSTPFGEPFRDWAWQHLQMSQRYFQMGLEIASRVPELEKYATWLQDALACVSEAAYVDDGNRFNVDQAAVSMAAYLSLKSPSTRYKGPEAGQVKSLREMGDKGVKAIAPILARGEEALIADLLSLSPHIRTLCSLVVHLLERSAEEKRQAGVLDFSDLEHYAYVALVTATEDELDRMRARYQHVFVDEYQDTSPIQDALVDFMTNHRDNLFAVGDVKQSIYRFRMAEPSLFLRRYEMYQSGEGGQSIDLTENYRSRGQVISFINDTFEQLFSKNTTDFAYDSHARMKPGAFYPDLTPDTPVVEVRLMNRSVSQGETEELGEGSEATDDVDVPALEREAHFVAQRILEMQGKESVQVWDKRQERNRPLVLGDIAILLRSGRDALNTVLSVLADYGIDASATTSTGFYQALEVQWLIAALSVIDNPLDDLALVTLLRSPLVGWNEDTLARVRLASHFSLWDALRKIRRQTSLPDQTEDGGDEPWRSKQMINLAQVFCERLTRWRKVSRQFGVADMIQRVLDDSDGLRYLAGMSRAAVRIANVDQLLQMARSYDQRTGHGGLFGFLQQWKKANDANLDLGMATVNKADAVQVMTIHKSKGLEFPVVFVMDIGKQFRLNQDQIAVHRDVGIGAIAYGEETQQRWRTAASLAVVHADRRATLAEEARILYVALTRARERLIIVGSARNLNKLATSAVFAHDPSSHSLLPGYFMQARSYMDWLVPILLRHPNASALHELIEGELWDGHVWSTHEPSLRVSVGDLERTDDGETKTPVVSVPIDMKRLTGALEQVAKTAPDPSTVRIVQGGAQDAEALYGKVSATDLRRLHVALQSKQVSRQHEAAAISLLEDPLFVRPDQVTPREEGVAFHAFMQRCSLPLGTTLEEIEQELERLVATGQLAEDIARAVDIHHVVAFCNSELGRRMQAGGRIYREQPFFHRIDVPLEGRTKPVPIVAQGVIDCLVEEDDGWLVIDYKTDHIQDGNVEEIAKEYEAQVATYLQALQPLTVQKPVRAYLYFVRASAFVEVLPMSLADVFLELVQRRREPL